MTPASNSSYLIDVTPGADHNITTETMGAARVVSPTCTGPQQVALTHNEQDLAMRWLTITML